MQIPDTILDSQVLCILIPLEKLCYYKHMIFAPNIKYNPTHPVDEHTATTAKLSKKLLFQTAVVAVTFCLTNFLPRFTREA